MRQEGDVIPFDGYHTSTSTLTGQGTFSITSSCPDVELAVSVLDWRYSEEGSFLFNYGIEGISFEYDANGEPQYTDLIVKNENGLSATWLAAVYMDGGYEAVKPIILKMYAEEEKLLSWQVKDGKGALQEYTQGHDMGLPSYEIIEAYGPDHDRHFTAQVSIQGKPMAQGRGCSKKHAEMEAAKKALEMLENQNQ